MASPYNRKNVGAIVNDETMTKDEQVERLFALYGQALDEGYISKNAAQAAQNAAIEAAKAEAVKGVQVPDVTTYKEYQDVVSERDMLRAIGGEDFSGVKPKFRETVYKMLDRSDKAPAVADQLKTIGEKYEEYFITETAPAENQPRNTPQYSQAPGRTGTNPTSKEDELFNQLAESWK